MKTQASADLNSEKIFSILNANSSKLRQLTVKKIGLFGSYARGEQTPKSDVDFLVEFGSPTFDNFMDLVDSLEKFLKKRTEVITIGSLSPRIMPFVEKEIRWYEVR